MNKEDALNTIASLKRQNKVLRSNNQFNLVHENNKIIKRLNNRIKSGKYEGKVENGKTK